MWDGEGKDVENAQRRKLKTKSTNAKTLKMDMMGGGGGSCCGSAG